MDPASISLLVAPVSREVSPSLFSDPIAFLHRKGEKFRKQASSPQFHNIAPHEYVSRGWNTSDKQWKAALWPNLDKDFRAAGLEGTKAAWKLQWQEPDQENKVKASTNEEPLDRKGKGRM